MTVSFSSESCSFHWVPNLFNIRECSSSLNGLFPQDFMTEILSKRKLGNNFDSSFLKKDVLLHEFFLLLIEKIKKLKQINLENYKELYNPSNVFYEIYKKKFLKNTKKS